jgi:hypothetical protein
LFPIEETVGAFAETAKSIIAAVYAERFDPAPSYQTCRFCDYADLCGVKEAEGSNETGGEPLFNNPVTIFSSQGSKPFSLTVIQPPSFR